MTRIFFICLLMLCACPAAADVVYLVVTPAQQKCIAERLDMEARLNAAYVWGAAKLEPGAPGDCSGKLSAVCESCGVDVKRQTVKGIVERKGGWRFPGVKYPDAKALAVVVLSMKRTQDHVGMLMTDVKYEALARMFHMSSKYGALIVTINKDDKRNYYYHRISLIRQVNWKCSE